VVTPRYRKIADELRHRITSGELQPGDQIPIEQDLQQHYEVSRNTIRPAVQALVAEGLLETRGRRGTFVRDLRLFTYNAQIYVNNPDYFGGEVPLTDSWTQQVAEAGWQWEQDFNMRLEAAEPSIASQLNLAPDTLVCIRDCHRYIGDTDSAARKPYVDEITFYVREVAEKCGLDSPHDIPEGTVRRMADNGYLETRYRDTVYGRQATRQEIDDFEIGATTPILVHDRLGLIGETPLRVTRLIMPTDRNRISYELIRPA